MMTGMCQTGLSPNDESFSILNLERGGGGRSGGGEEFISSSTRNFIVQFFLFLGMNKNSFQQRG